MPVLAAHNKHGNFLCNRIDEAALLLQEELALFYTRPPRAVGSRCRSFGEPRPSERRRVAHGKRSEDATGLSRNDNLCALRSEYFARIAWEIRRLEVASRRKQENPLCKLHAGAALRGVLPARWEHSDHTTKHVRNRADGIFYQGRNFHDAVQLPVKESQSTQKE